MPTTERLKLQVTPETIVINPTGEVLAVWLGAYGANLAPKVEAVFGVQLPEVAGSGATVH